LYLITEDLFHACCSQTMKAEGLFETQRK